MTRTRKRRRTSAQSERKTVAGGLPQLAWGDLVNPFAPMSVLSDDQLESIHRASLRILSELGIVVMSERALDLFAGAGGEVDRSSNTVRLDPALVETLVAKAPSSFTVTPRNPARRLIMGGNHINFGLVAGPPNVHDRERGRRVGNYRDYCDFIRLAHHFNIIHLIGNQVCAPVELPANSRHLEGYDANITWSDRVYHCSAIGRGRVLDGIKMMAISRGGSLEDMVREPGVLSIISVNSPRLFDDAMAEGLMTLAEYGQPAVVTPFTLMGAMTPVTLAAGLAQQNAEALFGIALTQIVRPGVPVVYGAYTSNVDMRSGAPAFGTPENTKANVASGQLARKYGLPYRCSPTNASNAADAQAVYETEMALWGCVMGHGNLVYHAAGWLEGGLTSSFEKFILDVEMLQHMAAFLKPIEVNEAELAFEAMREVPPGGHFFGAEHTMARYENAFYQPLVSNWQNYDSWTEAGGLTAEQRATTLWKQALSDYQQPEMDPAVREALDAYVARRKEEIGTGDP